MYRIIKEAGLGNKYAALGLGYSYRYGKYFEHDHNKAMEWYIRSAEGGCNIAYWELAKIFRDGTIAEKDSKQFIFFLRRSAEAGIPDAKMELALQYLSGEFVAKDEEEANYWMCSAAVALHPMAQFLTGYFAEHGIGVKKNKYEAESWYTNVSIRGNADLFYWIGRNYEFGLNGVIKDLIEAGRWYKIGADMGHEKCIICWRAVMDNLDKNKEDSLVDREFLLSHTQAEQEKAIKKISLDIADQYLEEDNIEMALENYEKAAQLDNPLALFTLAMFYHDGIVVNRSDRTALDLLAKASLAGSEDAQFMLGNLYERGVGFKKDLDEAKRYFTMAASNGYLTAYYKLGKYVEDPETYVWKTTNVKW